MLEILRNVLIYADPWGVVIPGLLFGTAFVLSHSGAVRHTDETSALAMIIVLIRRAALILFVAALPVFGMFIAWASKAYLKDNADQYIGMLENELKAAFGALWWCFFLLLIAPSVFRIVWLRWVQPELSSWYRNLRVRQSGDVLSDIRTELQVLKAKDFNPRDYYLDGQMFLGLDENDVPVYMDDEVFKKNHLSALGPTQVGKGVIIGVLMDQAIKKGWGLWIDDRKPDDFWIDIVLESCEMWGRPAPIVLDLNGVGPGDYAPFVFGSVRDRRERIVKAFGLLDTGNTADYYKKKERAVVDFLMPYWDGSLPALGRILEGKEPTIPPERQKWIQETSDHIKANLSEFSQLDTLMATPTTSFNPTEALQAGAVVYIRSSLEDSVVKKAFMALLNEVVQFARKAPLPVHTFFALDEARFSASGMLANSLATVLSKRLNMAICYQSRNDTLNLEDKTENGQSVQTGIETNTQVRLSYRCVDKDTAEWIAGQTGTVQKTVIRQEQIETNHAGAEEWTGVKSMASAEENYIPENRLLGLPARIAVLIRPNELATTLFTCWIPITRKRGLPPRAAAVPTSAPSATASSPPTPASAPPPAAARTTPAQPPASAPQNAPQSPSGKSQAAPITTAEDAALEAALAAIVTPAPKQPTPTKISVTDIKEIDGI